MALLLARVAFPLVLFFRLGPFWNLSVVNAFVEVAHLILVYCLYPRMNCYWSHPATAGEMSSFHLDNYVQFLSRVTPDNLRQFSNILQKYSAGITTGCTVFDG